MVNRTTVGFLSSSMHPMQAPVHKIQPCFMLCCRVSEPPLPYTDINAAVLLQPVLMMQAFLFAIQVESMMFSEMFPTQNQCHQCAPKIGHISGMSSHGLEGNMLLKTISQDHKLLVEFTKKHSLCKLHLVYKPTKTCAVPTESMR